MRRRCTRRLILAGLRSPSATVVGDRPPRLMGREAVPDKGPAPGRRTLTLPPEEPLTLAGERRHPRMGRIGSAECQLRSEGRELPGDGDVRPIRQADDRPPGPQRDIEGVRVLLVRLHTHVEASRRRPGRVGRVEDPV